MIYPQIILAGAPKCGTSTLFSWLSHHSGIEASNPKETFFFMDEGHPLLNKKINFYKDGWNSYGRFFKQVTTGKLYMEATTHYIYQENTAKILASLANPPKIIFVLRNPVDRLFSSFQYTKNNLAVIPAGLNFKSYYTSLLKSEPVEELKGSPSRFVLENDLVYGCYYDYLKYWYIHYPPQLIKVVVFEEMLDNFARLAQTILDFLELKESDIIQTLEKRNQTRTIRYKQIHYHLRKLTSGFSKSKNFMNLKKLYFRLQRSQDTQEKLAPHDREVLMDFYRPHNALLKNEFNLEISFWND